MNTKNLILAAAMAGLALGVTGCASNSQSADGRGECSGINSCKGKGDCSGQGHGCAGQNTCKGKGWKKTTIEECSKKKGQFKAT